MDEIFRLTRVDPVTGIAEPIPARERIDALLEHPRAEELIRSLDSQALYSLIHEAGLNDAIDLVLYAAPEQVQAIIDFDCWTRDDLELPRLTTWLEVLLQREDDAFNALIDEIDPEPLVLWIREQVALFLWEEDQDVIDTIEDPVSTSPDGVYALVIPDEENIGPLVRHFLERLYAKNLTDGHRFLEASRWELTGSLTETAYKLREARLGDLGFVPFHEAVEVYAFQDPARWAARARAEAMKLDAAPIELSAAGTLPPVDHQVQVLETKRFAEAASFFTRAMGALPIAFPDFDVEKIANSVLSQFRSVCNRSHIADLGNPGDMAAARTATDKVDNYLSIGLQLAARDDLTTAARVLATAPLKDIHRAGYSATAKLARQAKLLVERGNLTLVDGSQSLLEPAHADLVDGLLARRPTASGTYDTPFTSLEDVETVARVLSEIAFTELIFFGAFRHTRAELTALVFDAERNATPVEFVTFRSLFATRVLGELIAPGRELSPLALGDLHALMETFPDKGTAHERLLATGIRLVAERAPDAERLSGLATAYAARVAGWLLDEVGDVRAPVPHEIATQLLLVAPT